MLTAIRELLDLPWYAHYDQHQGYQDELQSRAAQIVGCLTAATEPDSNSSLKTVTATLRGMAALPLRYTPEAAEPALSEIIPAILAAIENLGPRPASASLVDSRSPPPHPPP